MTSADNKRVAKNAIALTLRMVFVTIVGLFTSRIVLQALGVDDYGIYGVIGGVVGMASFVNTSMAGATSRFITFELGRGNNEKLKTIFSTSLIIHIIIASGVAILAETVGLWFVNNKMNFPENRMFAVNVLYQFTILSMMVNFTQVPYSAAIIAHEKMHIYAYIEIINVVLKLLIVYLLLIVSTDRLILYGALILAVNMISAFVYRFYCIRHFQETHFSWVWNKPLMRRMLTFSGYDLYGNMCVVARNQGQPIVLNMFFGVVANAGSSIALTVTGAISGLTTTVAQAFKPQVIKSYASEKIEEMTNMMGRSLQFTLLAYSAIAIPVAIETQRILYLWLGQIPEYSCEFLRLILIASLIECMISTNNTGIHATGNIKRISFISGTFYLLSVIFSYIAFKLFALEAQTVYIINIIMLIFVLLLGWYFLKLQIPNFRLTFLIDKIVRVWVCIIITTSVIYLLSAAQVISTFNIGEKLSDSIVAIFKTCCISTMLLSLLTFSISLSRSERIFLIHKFIRKKR